MKARLHLLLLPWVAAGLPMAVDAQSTAVDPAEVPACASARATALPADMSGASVDILPIPKAYPKCDSYALYEKKDMKAARACAIQERLALLARLPGSPTARPPTGAANDNPAPAGGLIVLTELYANGEGVAQSRALAARFLCEAVETGEIELDGDAMREKALLGTLERLKGLTPASPPMSFCKVEGGSSFPVDQPEVPMTRYCGALEAEAQAEMHAGGIQSAYDGAAQDAANAATALKSGLRRLTPGQRAAYRRLTAAFDAFVKQQVTGNSLFSVPYSSGGVPGSGGIYPDAEHAAFDTQVAAFLTAPPPAVDATELQAADASLNKVYRDLIAAAALAAALPQAEVTTEMLRVEQRAWLAYRDAFVGFGKTLRPELGASAWLLPVTTARVGDLQQVYDNDGRGWLADAGKFHTWQAEAIVSHNRETASNRERVSEYFDHQTPEQAAAWQRLMGALGEFAAAHKAAVPNASPIYPDQQLDKLYGEIYAIGYNEEHHFSPGDPAKAEQGLVANERRMSAAYAAALGSACLFQPGMGDPPNVHRTATGLRGEQEAWLRMRNAWVDFLGTLFPREGRAALSNMITGSRAFELQMLTNYCKQSGQAPKEQ